MFRRQIRVCDVINDDTIVALTVHLRNYLRTLLSYLIFCIELCLSLTLSLIYIKKRLKLWIDDVSVFLRRQSHHQIISWNFIPAKLTKWHIYWYYVVLNIRFTQWFMTLIPGVSLIVTTINYETSHNAFEL